MRFEIPLFSILLHTSFSTLNEIRYQNPEEIIELYQNHVHSRNTKRNELSALGQYLSELFTFAPSNPLESSPRHILTIMSDDQGWGDIGYHDSTFVSPVIDFLAGNGIMLNNFYVQCTCTPTRASMMTGRYVTKTGLQDGAVIPGESRHLPRDFKTIGDYFKASGYSTYMLGKWHLGQEYTDLLPNARGYDYFYGSIGGVINHYDKEIGLACGSPGDQMSNIYGVEDCQLLNGYDLQENGVPIIEQETYNSYLQAKKAIDVISSHNSSTPMLMHYHTNEPHAPLQAPEELYDLCHGVSEPEPGVSIHHRQFICAMVLSIDISILQILMALRDNGNMLQNTLIVYHSDNGGWLNGGSVNRPFKGDKGTVYEGGIHVPAFLYGNGITSLSPSIRSDLVHVSDILPTLLSYASIPFLATQFDGMSHWAALQNSEPFSRSAVPVNSASAVVYYFSAYIEVMSGVTYKYLYNPSVVAFMTTASRTDTYDPEGEFLYNLSADPSEVENLLETQEESPEIWALLMHFRAQVFLFQENSVPSQLEVIPPKLEVFPSKYLCWIPKDSSLYYEFVCPNHTAIEEEG